MNKHVLTESRCETLSLRGMSLCQNTIDAFDSKHYFVPWGETFQIILITYDISISYYTLYNILIFTYYTSFVIDE
jgi:hypothetical protein